MNSSIVGFILTTFLVFVAQALDCPNNPCELGGYFDQARGYQCVQSNTQALCTCPDGAYEIDRPCRVCNRVNAANNPCDLSIALSCLETDEYGTTFACLCNSPTGPALTTSPTCDLSVTLTSTAMTTPSTLQPITTSVTGGPVTPPVCSNGGNFVDNSCHCPSGYGGLFCTQKFDGQLCERIICLNRGVCAIRNPTGPYESVCLCRYGTWGEYCHLNGTLGFCTTGLCMNGAACQENTVGSTRHAYCNCQPGYNGIRCDNQYFKCANTGKFVDDFMKEQGKYFECTQLNGGYRLEIKSCSKGLRFNTSKNTCTY